MKTHILTKPEEYTFQKLGVRGKKFDVNSLTPNSSFVYMETDTGHETTIINHVCDCYYYVLEGSGYFEIDDIKEEFRTGELVVIPAKSKFIYKGKCKLLRVTTPAFYPEQEETLA